jgi:hypothetical protein
MKALKELAAARDEYKAKIKEAGKAAIEEAAKSVFEAHAEINRIEWTQYTPYFNDGDPCVFRVGDVYFCGNAVDGPRRADEREDLLSVATGYGDKRKVLLAAADDFETTIHHNKDLLESTLDEGKVVITREGGLTVEEYDHDERVHLKRRP